MARLLRAATVLSLMFFACLATAQAQVVTVQYTTVSDYGSGFQGEITISNARTRDITDWTLAFDLNRTITSIYNATIVSRVGNRYTIKHANFNSTIPAGGSVNFGFTASPGNSPPPPTNYALNGVPLESQTGVIPGQAFPTRYFAPYVDVLLYPSFPFAATAGEIGVRHYTLAFVTAQSGCEASWGGVAPVKDGLLDEYLFTNINELRAAGGNVIVSFGGATGTELAQSCSSVAALAAQYRLVINRYNLTHLDFDIEGAAMADAAANERRNQAIAILQSEAASAERQLVVSYTLPVSTAGLTRQGSNILLNAVRNGVAVGTVNIMTMNFGGNANPNTMGQNAIDAANATITQLQEIFPHMTPAQLRSMLGVTPMIGMNDITTEIFTLADADKVLNYASTTGIGRLAMWSMTRDKQCSGNPTPGYVSPTCSSIAQGEFEFAKKFKAFTTPTRLALAPVADAWVQGADAFRNTNYGASAEMQIKRTLNPGAGRGRRGFLRFDTSSVTGAITSAKLRVHSRLTDAALPPTTMIVQKVTDTAWNEMTLTWNNQPAVASPDALAQIIVANATGQYYEFDLAQFLQQERAAGRTIVSLRLINQTATGNSGASFSSVTSREAASNRPQLVIEQ